MLTSTIKYNIQEGAIGLSEDNVSDELLIITVFYYIFILPVFVG